MKDDTGTDLGTFLYDLRTRELHREAVAGIFEKFGPNMLIAVNNYFYITVARDGGDGWKAIKLTTQCIDRLLSSITPEYATLLTIELCLHPYHGVAVYNYYVSDFFNSILNLQLWVERQKREAIEGQFAQLNPGRLIAANNCLFITINHTEKGWHVFELTRNWIERLLELVSLLERDDFVVLTIDGCLSPDSMPLIYRGAVDGLLKDWLSLSPASVSLL